VISFAQRRRATVKAERAERVAECMRAELARMRASYEAVAAGTGPSYFGMTPERARLILAEWDRPDPPPAHYDPPPWAGPEPELPAYMPPGAPRPMSIRGTVRALNDAGGRVPLWLQLLAAASSPRQMRRAFKALAGRATLALIEAMPHWAAEPEAGESPRRAGQWLEVCLRCGPPLMPATGGRHVIPP
jgi:hypothetical protein